MSLILEALRKSEAERRRGLPPDLHAELPPPAARARRWPRAAWVPALASLAAIAGWWLWSRPAPDAVAPVPAHAPARPSTPVSSPAGDDAITRSPAATAAALPARTPAPVPVVDPPALPAAVADQADASSDAATQRAAHAPAAPAPASPTSPASPAKPGPPAEAAATTATPAPAPAAAPDGRILSLSGLDPDTRKALPPLRLSMHLWNEDPAQRFVILDGQRLGEGDRAGDATIVRIERDGVLLDWNGRGIRIPVR